MYNHYLIILMDLDNWFYYLYILNNYIFLSNNSSLLNEFFYQKAFSDKEKAQIIKTKVVNEDNDAFDTKGGKDTNDYVSLLSIQEVGNYFKESSERSASFTDGNGTWWWLRSPGFEQNNAANVGDYGSINKAGHKVYDDDVVNGGVRPVIHISVK